jgi:HK97 family phage major capsid protein
MSLPAAEAVVRQDLAEQLSLAVDLAALRGTGAGNQPLGIANTSGINTVVLGANGSYLSDLDLFFNMIAALEEDNALKGKLGFVVHPKVKSALRKLKTPQFSGDTGGEYALPPVVTALLATDRALEEALGYPLLSSTQIPVNLTKGTSSDCT